MSKMEAIQIIVDDLKKKYKAIISREEMEEDTKWYETVSLEKVMIKNKNDAYIATYLFNAGYPTTLLCLHDLEEDASSILNRVELLRKIYPETNIVLYDLYAHGLSEGFQRGLGDEDLYDLKYLNKFVLQKFGENQNIILYGCGMGGNIILNASALDQLKNVKLIIVENTYKSVQSFLSAKIADNRLSKKFIQNFIRNNLTSIIHLEKMRTLRMIAYNKIPLVYIHSNDSIVDYHESLELYNRTQSKKAYIPVKGNDIDQELLEECLEEIMR